MKRSAACLAAAGVLFASLPALGQMRSHDPVSNPIIDYDQPERARLEARLPSDMPAVPAPEVLRPFEVSATSTNQFGIDPKSIEILDNRVIQFTLVVTSKAGVRNISYNALDCEGRRVALLATGRDADGWSSVQKVSWRPVPLGDTVNAWARELDRIWCDGRAAAGKTPELLRRLAQPMHNPAH